MIFRCFLGDLIVGMKIKASLLVNINIQMIKLAGKTQILKRSTDDIMCFFCQNSFGGWWSKGPTT